MREHYLCQTRLRSVQQLRTVVPLTTLTPEGDPLSLALPLRCREASDQNRTGSDEVIEFNIHAEDIFTTLLACRLAYPVRGRTSSRPRLYELIRANKTYEPT